MGPSLAHRIRIEAHAVWLAVRAPETPLAAKLIGWLVAAYAFSPIDLIPDFVPVLGLVDDAILIPIGIWLFERLMPPGMMASFRAEAEAIEAEHPRSMIGLLIVLLLWALFAWLAYSVISVYFD
jgi:uncharacterized membrane protein YkvA (DUF1232 family)